MGIWDKQASSRCGVTQSVAYTGSSATVTNPFGSTTLQIRLSSTSACYYKVVEASGGAAAATDVFLPNNWVEYVNVSPGQKVSAIQAPTNGLVTATAGTLSVTEMS
jgi:hypothetical protein